MPDMKDLFYEKLASDKMENMISLFNFIDIDNEGKHLYYTNHSAEIEVLGKNYKPININFNSISKSSKNEINQIQISVIDENNFITRLMEKYNSFRGTKVIIRTGFVENIEDDLMCVKDTFEIKSAMRDEYKINFTLSFPKEFKSKTPKRNFARNHCQFNYGGEGCFRIMGQQLNYVSGREGEDIFFTAETSYKKLEVGDYITFKSAWFEFDEPKYTIKKLVEKPKYTRILKIDSKFDYDCRSGWIGLTTFLDSDFKKGENKLYIDKEIDYKYYDTIKLSNENELLGKYEQNFTVSGTNGKEIILLNNSKYYFPSGTTVTRKYKRRKGMENLDVNCDKKLDSDEGCEFHNNSKNFGGFPSLPDTGRNMISL